jgi:signal transduction histidine kinase
MLDFSRRSESKRTVCDLCAIIDKAVLLAASDYDLKKNYDFKQIKVVKDFPETIPPFNCTETEIEQVVLNLLRNAAQAMADSDPPTTDPEIRLRVTHDSKRIRLEITDNGPGIAPEVKNRIFEPFFTTKPIGQGTGLGLSVSYFIITKGHDGTMDVESAPGQGTAFIIELPLDTSRTDEET